MLCPQSAIMHGSIDELRCNTVLIFLRVQSMSRGELQDKCYSKYLEKKCDAELVDKNQQWKAARWKLKF